MVNSDGRLTIGIFVTLLLLAGPGCQRTAPASSGEGSAEIENVAVLKLWRGSVEKSGKERQERVSFPAFVSNADAFTTLWERLQIEESRPAIDFDESLILVAVVSASSGVQIHPTLDRQGDLKRNVVALPMPNPKGWEYALFLIERDGVKSVEGEPVPE